MCSKAFSRITMTCRYVKKIINNVDAISYIQSKQNQNNRRDFTHRKNLKWTIIQSTLLIPTARNITKNFNNTSCRRSWKSSKGGRGFYSPPQLRTRSPICSDSHFCPSFLPFFFIYLLLFVFSECVCSFFPIILFLLFGTVYDWSTRCSTTLI